ncbi:MAG: thymidine phosphorylase, partial [Candidatus Bathyarchaeota archaeon]
AKITSDNDGRALWINNKYVAHVAREAGAPKEKGAGVLLKVKLGKQIRKGDTLFEIYAERDTKLHAATELAERLQPIGLSKRPQERMLMGRMPTRAVHRKTFMLER